MISLGDHMTTYNDELVATSTEKFLDSELCTGIVRKGVWSRESMVSDDSPSIAKPLPSVSL